MRQYWVLVHRYAGLSMALFLIVIGLTGSIIVFNPELNAWLDPLPAVIPRSAGVLDPITLHDRAQALVPHGIVYYVPLNIKANEAYVVGVEPRSDPATGRPYELDLNTLYLDPYSGAELRRESVTGSIWPITRKNVVTLVNRLHYQLALPGSVGTYLFGIVALIWTLDCLVSLYLTFPLRLRVRSASDARGSAVRGRSWLARWWNPAWLVKWRGSFLRVNFDLHRAGGLWVWVLLLAIAWSSVGFNLADQVYTPVMRALFGMRDQYGNDLPTLPTQAAADVDWRKAHAAARQLMADQARIRGFSVLYEDGLLYRPDKGAFFYVVRSDRDIVDSGAATSLLFDRTGHLLTASVPSRDNTGTTLQSWIFALHTAQVWGLPFRIFVSLVGVLTALLSITGVYIWLKKRAGARRSHRHRPLDNAKA